MRWRKRGAGAPSLFHHSHTQPLRNYQRSLQNRWDSKSLSHAQGYELALCHLPLFLSSLFPSLPLQWGFQLNPLLNPHEFLSFPSVAAPPPSLPETLLSSLSSYFPRTTCRRRLSQSNTISFYNLSQTRTRAPAIRILFSFSSSLSSLTTQKFPCGVRCFPSASPSLSRCMS